MLVMFIAGYVKPSFAGGVVVVHPSNAAAFDSKTVQRIFLGKLNSFSTGEKVIAVDLQESLDIHKQFSEKVLKKKQSQLKSYWAKLVFTGKGKPPKKVDSAAAIITAIKEDSNTIAYMDASDVTDDVKVVLEF